MKPLIIIRSVKPKKGKDLISISSSAISRDSLFWRIGVFILLMACAAALFLSGAHAQQPEISLVQLTPREKALDEELEIVKSKDKISVRVPIPGELYKAWVRLPFQPKVSRVHYRVNRQGEAVFGGDMILGPATEIQRWSVEYDTMLKNFKQSGLAPSLAIDDAQYRWIGGVMPYKISGDFKKKTIKAINDAVDQLNINTNLRLVPYDRKAHKDYVDIVIMKEKIDALGLSSIGRRGGRQKLYLKDGIAGVRTPLHELMHALGFRHEHTRPDRDQFITIKLYNVKDKKGIRENFFIDENNFSIGPYDIESITHYGGFAYAKPCNLADLGGGKKCGRCDNMLEYQQNDGDCLVVIKDLAANQPVEEKHVLSSGDIYAINALYPEELPGTGIPPTTQLRTVRTTIERLITRAGPNESRLCGNRTDYLLEVKVGPAVSTPGVYENRFDENRASSWQSDKPERSNDFRPNWRLDAPVDANTDMVRVDVYVYDHDDALCGGKDDVVDINPTVYAFLRLLVDTDNGDWSHLKYEKYPFASYPKNTARGGNIFDSTTNKYKTLIFNGLKDGEIDYNDEAEIRLKIEIL